MRRIVQLPFFVLLLLCQFAFLNNTFAQAQTIGSYPTMQGGAENQTAGTLSNNATIATGVQNTSFTHNNNSSSSASIISNSSNARTGSKYISWDAGSTSSEIFTPSASNGGIVNSTSYTVQFYYQKNASATSRIWTVGVTTDGTSGSATANTSATLSATTWTRVQLSVTSGTSANSPKYGIVRFKPSGGSWAGNPYLIDDICIYAGAADNTAPGDPTAASTGSATSSSLNVSWSAPAGGVDGGGYLVVRHTADPTTAPNVNGIYGVGNSIGSGSVVYIGTSTNFVDNNLAAGTQYFYRVYTVDKAFNYSAAATTNGTTSSPDPEPTNHVTSFAAGTLTSSSINLTWVDATGGQLPVGYIIKASTTSFAAIADPVDGTAESDATLVKNITQGTQTVSFTGLTSNTTYYFKIYPYTNGGTAINYKTDGSVPQISATTSYVSSASDQFRSNAASGVWATAGDWQSSPNGTDWYTATLAPTTSAASITIRNGHTISMNATASADDMTIDAGGKLIVNNITFTVANGAAATDLTVNGTMELTGSSGAVTATGAITFGSGSTYTHNANGRTIPTATWNSNSTVEITGVTSTQPSGLGQTFGNFTWNCGSQSANVGLGSPASFAIAGNLTVTSTGGVTNRAVRLTAGTNYTLSVGGNLILNGGHLGLTSGAGTMALTVSGNVTLSNSSELYLSQGGSVNGTLNVGGDFTAAAGTTITETGSSTGHTIVFNKSGTQSLSASSATFSNDLNYTVNIGSTVNLSGTFTVNASRALTLNGNFAIGSGSLVLNGIAIAGTPTNLSSTSSSSLTMGGATAGISIPSSITDLSNLTINNTSGISLNGDIAIADLLTVGASAILDAGTNQLTGAGTGTWNINGTLKTADTDGLAGASKTIPSATIALGSSSTIEYNAASGTQTVDGRTDYANLILSGNAAKTISSGIEIGGNFTVTGGTATPPATVTFDGTSGTQSVAGLVYETIAFNGAANKTFNSDGSVSTAITFASGQAATIDFDGAGSVVFTIKSTAAYTARIENKQSYTLSGNIKAERYYPSRRAWRLMSAPVSSTGSIYSLWQNGGTNTAGIGTLITGPGANPATNGLDASTQNTTTLYTYNQAGNSWTAVSNTLTTNVSDNAAYFIFVRGDRNTNNLTPGVSNTTTLHSTGTIKSGDQNFSTNTGTGYTLLGNPYPSPIDFNLAWTDAANGGSAGTTNVLRKFYTYDPNIGDRGGYVTVSWNGVSYDVVPSSGVTSQTQHIQSGQGFFIEADGSANTNQFTLKESHKSSTNINDVFRAGTQFEKLAVTLKRTNTDGSIVTMDGILANFHNSFSAAVSTAEDASKFTNFDESISFRRNGSLLSIEAMPLADVNDTLFINIANMKQRAYEFIFEPSSFNAPGLTAYLEDDFTGSATQLSLTVPTSFQFTVTSNTATSAADRFRIVFKSSTPLPVSFINLKAYEKNNAIQVEWTNASESGVNRYEVEESSDAVNFTKSKTFSAKANNNTAVNYSWLDNSVVNGSNYYRVKSFGNNGEIKLSSVVRVNIGKGTQGIGIYPNPVSGGSFNLLMNMESGNYTLDIYNSAGQKMMSRSFIHNGGSATQSFVIDKQLKPGVYQLVVQNVKMQPMVQTIIIND